MGQLFTGHFATECRWSQSPRNFTVPKMNYFSIFQVLTHLMELFSTLFNDKLCDQLLKHLKKWMDNYIFSANPHQLSIKVLIVQFYFRLLTCCGKVKSLLDNDLSDLIDTFYNSNVYCLML